MKTNQKYLICHALTGDANVMGKDETSEVGWDNLVGPNKAIDTNTLLFAPIGYSCKGSLRACFINPKRIRYGPSFQSSQLEIWCYVKRIVASIKY